MNNNISIIQDAQQIFEVLKSDFSDLWSIKHRQKTLEFITPYTTMSGEAISVFLTQRDIGYVVSDGGRLFDIAVEQAIDIRKCVKIHYSDMIEKYAIKEIISHDKRRFCYKVEKDIRMLSSLVYDLAIFQEIIANAIYLETLFEIDESHEARYFAKRVRDLLHDKIQNTPTDKDKYELFSDNNTRCLRFSAGIHKIGTDSIWLGMAIHRSNLQNYERSVTSAEFAFRRADRYFPKTNLSMSAIVDILPDELIHNYKASFYQKEMEAWRNDFMISNLSYEQIEKMDSIKSLFVNVA